MRIWLMRIVGWSLYALIMLAVLGNVVFAVVDVYKAFQPEDPSPVVLRILGEGGEVYEFTKKDVKHFHAWWAAWMEGVE